MNSIISSVKIREVKPYGVELLMQSIQKHGFQDSFPLLVAPVEGGYELLNGKHRFEAAVRLGLETVPVLILNKEMTDIEKKKLAIATNNATESIVPTTFVDNAEFIWREVESGKTQAEIAEIMGWSREQVAQYVRLQKICKDAWDIIVTTFENVVTTADESSVTNNVTSVTFTENLLRSIIQLTPKQQLELIKEFAAGNISKGKFNVRAKAYKIRNEIKEYAKKQIGSYGEEYLKECFEEIDKGIFDKEWETGQEMPKLKKLFDSLKEKWEKKNSIILIHGDFYEEVFNISDGSIDLILTDPPYNVSNERVFKFAGRSDIDQNFGEWDKFEHEAFTDLFHEWGKHFYRILREGGSGYVFTSDKYLSFLIRALEESGLEVKNTIVWHKTNPGTQVMKTCYRSSTEYIVFFVKGKNHTFNWQGENEMHNFIECPICSGSERLKDAKGNTLHPTQKPEYIIRHLLEISSNRGDMVFDGFAGVGTTAKVCKDLGRRSINIESNQEFFDAMRSRLE